MGGGGHHLDFPTAVERFERIRETKPTGKWEVLFLTSFANASFCRLFGGDAVAMLIVFASTLAGYRLKQIMLEDKRDVRLTFCVPLSFPPPSVPEDISSTSAQHLR